MPRRTAVICAAFLVMTACSAGGSGRAAVTSLPPRTTQAGADTVLRPSTIFGTRSSPSSGFQRLNSTASSVEVGFYHTFGQETAGPVIVEFQRPSIPPECVQRAILEFSMEGINRETVAVYPADPKIMALSERENLPYEFLMDNRPRGVVTFEGLRGHADITDLYRAYLGKGYFPAGRGFAEGARPNLVVAVQPESATDSATFRIVTSDAGDSSPLLRLSSRC